MKKNHLMIAKTNSNQHKRRRAKLLLGLSLSLLFVVAFITLSSIVNADSVMAFVKCFTGSTATLAFLPLVANVKGVKAINGFDETDEEYAARAGKAETDAMFAKRFMLHSIKSAIELESGERKKELQTISDDLKKSIPSNDLIEAIKGQLKELGLKFESISESGKRTDTIKNVRGQLEDWVKDNKSALDMIKAGQKAELKPFKLKVAANSPMTPSNTFSASTYLPQVSYIPGVTEIVRVEPTTWDYIRKGKTDSAALVWVNKYTPGGAADFIGPGVAKPGVSFKLQSEVSVAKKVAASEKCATELLDDIPGMQTFLEQELMYNLKYALNDAVLNGVSSSTDIAGLISLASSYSLTTVKTTSPNNWDAIIACVAQLRSGNLKGPVTAFVNPIDHANMILTKATSQGQLFVPAQSGVTIVEDNNVAVGSVLVALLDYYKIDIYKDMEITFGWENDDFTKNLVTAVCESRIHQRMSSNHTGAIIYAAFADIKTAIEE